MILLSMHAGAWDSPHCHPSGQNSSSNTCSTDQALLDILKQPFAVDDLRQVVLRAWEIKYGRQFDNDLWRFVQWATRDPRTSSLDFTTPPRLTFPQGRRNSNDA
jgi:hypothetical protein